jgi:NodT family efflux transporter outer membrane factor (OMF) lipoprotein
MNRLTSTTVSQSMTNFSTKHAMLTQQSAGACVHDMAEKTSAPSRDVPAWLRYAAMGCVVAWLGGCSMAPTYQRPSMDIPSAYKEAQTSQVSASGVWQPANPVMPGDADTVPVQWWKLFGDEVLNGLQEQAAAANPGIAQTVARLRTAQAALSTSQAAQMPTLGATASRTRSRNASTVSANGVVVTPGIAQSNSLGLTASWEVDLWGRLSNAVDASRASVQASADDVAAMRLSVQASVTQSYFAIRAAEAQIVLLEDALKAYETSWQLTRNRYQAGVVSSADVAQAETQYKTTQVQLLEARTSRAQLEHALAALLGQVPAAFSLPVTAQLPTPPSVPLLLPSQLLERRPDIAAAERRVAAANAQIGVARAAFFPSLSLSASAGYRGSVLSDVLSAPNLFWSVGPSLALSLLDGGARSAAVESARASMDLAAATYRQTVIAALQEVEDNLVAASALEQEQLLQEQAYGAANKSLQVVSNQYRAGMVAFLNVLTAQTTALSAQRSLVDVRNRRLQAVNLLLKNVAGRWDMPHAAATPLAGSASPDSAAQ